MGKEAPVVQHVAEQLGHGCNPHGLLVRMLIGDNAGLHIYNAYAAPGPLTGWAKEYCLYIFQQLPGHMQQAEGGGKN